MPFLLHCSAKRIKRLFGLAWLFGACTSVGCAEHVSTSNYAVAAGFAAAAGALQVAELANKGASPRTCGPKTCQGCCDLADRCVDGTADEACGERGGVCRNCEVNGQQTCGDGSCSPGPTSGQSRVALGGPTQSGATPAARASSPACGRPVLFCFWDTHPVCVTDDHGCQLCSCTPDARFDWPTPR